MESVEEGLCFIDNVILKDMGKDCSVGNVEDLRDYVTSMHNDKYVEEMVALLSVLSQINLIIEKIYLDEKWDFKKENGKLRKRILDWLRACNTKADIVDQQ